MGKSATHLQDTTMRDIRHPENIIASEKNGVESVGKAGDDGLSNLRMNLAMF